jgi:hypothetical protein
MARIDDPYMVDLDRTERTVIARIGRHAGDLLDQIIVVALPKDVVVGVEMRSRNFSNEELRSVGVRSAVGHSEASRDIEGQVALFITETVAGASAAVAQRVTTLDHEVGNHAVEDGPVVKRFVVHGCAAGRVLPVFSAGGEADEVVDGNRGLVGEQRTVDVAGGRFKDGFDRLRCSRSSRLGGRGLRRGGSLRNGKTGKDEGKKGG